jgi:hypothetical protein
MMGREKSPAEETQRAEDPRLIAGASEGIGARAIYRLPDEP